MTSTKNAGYIFSVMGSKNWCFTLNNYSDEDITRLSNLVASEPKVLYIIFGKEVGDSGTPHLQGFLSLQQRMRLGPLKRIVSPRAHLKTARNVFASIQYCKKDNDWVEFGTMSPGQGKRNDIEDFKKAVKEGMFSLRDVREEHSEVYAKYTRYCQEYIRDNMPKVVIPDHNLRPWQEHLNSLLSEPADRRTIIFVIDYDGNSGKSWFADWYQQKTGDSCQVITPGRRVDMAYTLNLGLKVLLMDAPRAKQNEFIQYDFLEDLKNGRILSSKYESIMKTFEPMHVVVFMNEDPDMTKLSLDRYKIINVKDFSNP